MKRIPNDLTDKDVREKYLKNHKEWLLKYHPDALVDFYKAVQQKYGTDSIEPEVNEEMSLFSF